MARESKRVNCRMMEEFYDRKCLKSDAFYVIMIGDGDLVAQIYVFLIDKLRQVYEGLLELA